MDTITSILEIQIMPQIQVPPQQMRMMLNSADNFLKKFESMLPDEKGMYKFLLFVIVMY